MVEVDERLERLIRELVRIETENPPGNEKPAAEFVVDWFTREGIEAALVEEPDPDRPQAVAEVGTGSPRVVLNGHVDVVPAGDRGKWSYDPYAAEVVDGCVYGRGSADMKTGVACGMLAAARLRPLIESGEVPGSVVVHGAMGEETGEPGTKSLLEAGYGGTYGVVLEPTGLRTATSAKGLAWYEITVHGEPVHASRPDAGVNAIDHGRTVLEALTGYDERVGERSDPLVGRAYATVTGFRAGTKENVLPEAARITVDRRVLPEESIAGVDAEIDEVVEAVADEAGVVVEWRRTGEYEAAEIPRDSHLAEVFRERSASMAGVAREPWGMQGATDVRNFVNDAGVEAITWGPGDVGQAHTIDEHVRLDEAQQGLEVLVAAVTDLLSEAA